MSRDHAPPKRPFRRLSETGPLVRRLHAQGLHDGDIGRELGLSDDRVRQIRRALGLPVNALAVGEARAANLLQGHPCPPTAVRNREEAARMGWPGRTRREAEVLSAVYAAGRLTLRQLAAAIGRSYRTAHHAAARLLALGDLRLVRAGAPRGVKMLLAPAEGVAPVGPARARLDERRGGGGPGLQS